MRSIARASIPSPYSVARTPKESTSIRHRNVRSTRAKSFLADMFRGLSTNENNNTASPAAFLDVAAAPTWDELQEMAAAKSVELGVPLPKNEDLEDGPPNPLSLRRMFGTKDEPRVKLYRDHAAWCPYCHKVVLQLVRSSNSIARSFAR